MTPDPGRIEENDFYERFKPINNPRSDDEGWERDEIVGAGIPVERVWAVVTGDNNSMSAIPGFHMVNVMHYLVTEEPWPLDTSREWDQPVPEGVWAELIEEHEVCNECFEHFEMGETCLEAGECKECCPDWADHQKERI